MATLHEITDENELKKYLEKFRTEPKYRPFFNSLKFRFDGLFPKQPFQLFVQNEYMTNYFYGLTTCKYETSDTRSASVIVEHEGPFDDTEFIKGMEALLKKSTQKLAWVLGNYHSCLLAERYVENSMPRISTKAYICKRYYMDEEQMRDLMNWKCPALQNGYELGNIDPEEDFEYVAESWRHARPDHYQMIKTRLEKLPTSCIRYKGKIVAHEWLDHHGEIRNQFTHPDHRQKGLGTIVELNLMQKSIQAGLLPFKSAEREHDVICMRTEKCPYWTIEKNFDDSDIVITHLSIFDRL